MRAMNSADLKGRGAAWKDSCSAKEGGAGVADAEPATADWRPLKLLHVQAPQ